MSRSSQYYLQSVARVLLPLTMLALFGPGCAGRTSCTDCCTNTIGCADLGALGVEPTGGCDAALTGRYGSCEDFCKQLEAVGALPQRTFVACEYTSKNSGPAIACSFAGLCALDAGQWQAARLHRNPNGWFENDERALRIHEWLSDSVRESFGIERLSLPVDEGALRINEGGFGRAWRPFHNNEDPFGLDEGASRCGERLFSIQGRPWELNAWTFSIA